MAGDRTLEVAVTERGWLLILLLYIGVAAFVLGYATGCFRRHSRGGLVDMGLPKPTGTGGRWDSPPVDFDG